MKASPKMSSESEAAANAAAPEHGFLTRSNVKRPVASASSCAFKMGALLRAKSPRSVVVAFALLALAFGHGSHAAAPVPINDAVEGQKLARELRAVAPAENTSLTATLRLTAPGQLAREVPLKSTVSVTSSNWTSIYEAHPTNAPAEVLTILHVPGEPNQYEWRQGERVTIFRGDIATNHFAGSDFALIDLGLEFYHWPIQSLAFRQMRKSQGCDVLESRPALVTLYTNVLSWIPQEARAEGTPGVLMAEAYDRKGLLKEFEIKDFERIAGRWEVREMEIRNVRARTSTRLRFHFHER